MLVMVSITFGMVCTSTYSMSTLHRCGPDIGAGGGKHIKPKIPSRFLFTVFFLVLIVLPDTLLLSCAVCSGRVYRIHLP